MAVARTVCPHCGSSALGLVEWDKAGPALYWCRNCWVPWCDCAEHACADQVGACVCGLGLNESRATVS